MTLAAQKFMRMIVFFDLPTITVKNKRDYVKFRRFLLKDGYIMLQWSVYCRIIAGKDSEQTHFNRIKSNLPPVGSVRCLTVTEKQYASIEILVGKPRKQELKVGGTQLLLF